eukprot:2859073-Rhodomonas_salina.1
MVSTIGNVPKPIAYHDYVPVAIFAAMIAWVASDLNVNMVRAAMAAAAAPQAQRAGGLGRRKAGGELRAVGSDGVDLLDAGDQPLDHQQRRGRVDRERGQGRGARAAERGLLHLRRDEPHDG